MSTINFKISDAELEVMRILWREKQAVSFSDIRTELSDTVGWEKSTIATLLRRLQKKGAISIQEKEIHYYAPNITKEDYIMFRKRSLIDKLYDGSTKNFVAALCQNGELTEADIESVIKRLDRKGMQQYGDTLIAVAADSIRKMPLSVTMFEDKKNLKERLGAIMKHKKYPRRTVITASIVLVTIVCVILGTSALHGTSRHDYMDNFSLQDQMQIREGKLKEAIRNYDKENNLAALVSINYLDSGEITNAYIYHKPWRKS